MPTLITGSFAFDTIMVFDDKFANHILPEHTRIINVSFLVPQLRREFGGCAGNIAYNLKLLGGDPLPLGAVGRDFAPYRAWLAERGIALDFVFEAPGEFTAQAFVTTDQDNNQITAFHPGAMALAHRMRIDEVVAAGAKIDLGIVAPNGRDAMLQHAAQLKAAGIPFIFDPGQGLPMFAGDALRACIGHATYLVLNDYESELLRDKTGLSLAAITAQTQATVITRARKARIFMSAVKSIPRFTSTQCASRKRATPPAAATPFAPVCYTASRAASTGARAANSPRSWAA